MNELRQKRKELGYTQVEAAKVCGVSRRTYQNYEEKDVAEEVRQKILDILSEGEQNRILSFYTIKLKCIEIFKKYPEVRCAYLYGSYARTFVENVLVEGIKIDDKRIDFTKNRNDYQIYRYSP